MDVIFFQIHRDGQQIAELACADDQVEELLENEYPGTPWRRTGVIITLNPPAEGEADTVTQDNGNEEAMQEYANRIFTIHQGVVSELKSDLQTLRRKLRQNGRDLASTQRMREQMEKIQIAASSDLKGQINQIKSMPNITGVDANGEWLIVRLFDRRVKFNVVSSAVEAFEGGKRIKLPTNIEKSIPSFMASYNVVALVTVLSRFFASENGSRN